VAKPRFGTFVPSFRYLAKGQEKAMLGKLIGAIAGAQAAEHTRKVGGGSGAVLGAVAAPLVTRLVRRMGPLGWIAAGVGAYAYKRYNEKPKTRRGRTTAAKARTA
jgi:hypothetical protein